MFLLRLLGGATIKGADGPVGGRAAQRRRVALLAVLAAARGNPVSRDRLIALLWPEKDTESARRLLSESLYIVRKSLGDTSILAGGDDLRLNPEVITSDLEQFETALARGEAGEAVAVYAGPFLDGFFVDDAPEFERWAQAERDRLGRAFGAGLERLAEEEERLGHSLRAVEWWRRLATHDPLSGRIAVHLMEALERAGDRAGALRHARTYEALVREELEADPEPQVLALSRRLKEMAGTEPAWSLGPRAGSSGDASEPVSPPPPIPLRRARPVAAGAVVLLLLLLGGAGWLVLRPHRPPASASVAVLPFVNLSVDSATDYFGEGMTEELIHALSRVEGLRVPARTSSFQFRGTAGDIHAVGRKLGVTAVVEGSVRRDGDALRVTAQLIDVDDGYHLWSQTYDRRFDDVLQVQEEIARNIVQALLPKLPGGSRTPVVRAGTADPEAHNLYLRGRYAWNQRTPESLRAAIRHFRDAIDRDPTYARAYSGLADTYLTLFDYELLPPAEATPLARVSVGRALEIDSSLAEAHTSLAHLLLHEWDWTGSLAEFKRALDLDPGYAPAYHWYALGLTTVGRVEEAVAAARHAKELDPLSARMNADLGMAYYGARQYDRAIEQERKTLELEPDFPTAHWIMGMAYEQSGRLEDAAHAFQRALARQPDNPNFLAALARTRALAGRRPAALAMLDTLRNQTPVPSFFVALVYVALNDRDQAFEWLDRALAERSGSVRYLKVEPRLDPLRADRRFADLLRKAGLSP